jgi:L-alanine-DL-glutamate epimerase-like enolase superfamily enzyme
MNPTDIRIRAASWYAVPIQLRIPLKFGAETVTSVVCARVCIEVERADGTLAKGWGETPLSVQWVWPSQVAYLERLHALVDFCNRLTRAYTDFRASGHAFEIGHAFLQDVLPALLHEANAALPPGVDIPHLAALVCASPFDLALHDAYGVAHDVPTYSTYCKPWMDKDLSHYLQPAEDVRDVHFQGLFPADFFRAAPETSLLAWHLVGGLDPLEAQDPGAGEVQDGYPSTLCEWIERDGLQALKVKLRGNDAAWDFERLKRVGSIGLARGVHLFTADFNCTVTDPAYVTDILTKLRAQEPALWEKLAYVEQPFPYDLEAHPIPVHTVSEMMPLFLDESAHDWTLVRLGRSLGWNGVALKTCKTQTGALLSLCWARAHGMQLMVQDLTNPMLAQITHALLAAHAPTLAGVETNGMQFYPDASAPEAVIHPGLYRRHNGHIDLTTIKGAGFGYRLEEIQRDLGVPQACATRQA